VRSTIPVAVSDRPVQVTSPAGFETFINRELRPWMIQANRILNVRSIEIVPKLQSDGAATALTIWTSPPMPQDCLWRLEADVTGMSTTVKANYIIMASFESTAGTCGALGTQTYIHQAETDALCDAQFVLDAVARTVSLQVTDNGAVAMQWDAVAVTKEGFVE
jgi:hypothetical protein